MRCHLYALLLLGLRFSTATSGKSKQVINKLAVRVCLLAPIPGFPNAVSGPMHIEISLAVIRSCITRNHGQLILLGLGKRKAIR